MDDLREQVSVRQFSCIHGVEPDGWCAQCDPEESARYQSLGACRCGPDATGEAPDVRPDCVPCNKPGADIGEAPF